MDTSTDSELGIPVPAQLGPGVEHFDVMGWPLVSCGNMRPGQPFRIDPETMTQVMSGPEEADGVVDPFLICGNGPIPAGVRCWGILSPAALRRLTDLWFDSYCRRYEISREDLFEAVRTVRSGDCADLEWTPGPDYPDPDRFGPRDVEFGNTLLDLVSRVMKLWIDPYDWENIYWKSRNSPRGSSNSMALSDEDEQDDE